MLYGRVETLQDLVEREKKEGLGRLYCNCGFHRTTQYTVADAGAGTNSLYFRLQYKTKDVFAKPKANKNMNTSM